MMDREIRLEPDCLLAVDQGFLGLTAVEEDQAEPAPGRGVPGCQLDGATQVLERQIVLAQLAQHHREITVSLGKARPQLQGTPEVARRVTRPAERLDRQTERAQGLRIVRIQLQRRATAADRSRQLAEVSERFGQREMERRCARPFHDRPLENFDSEVILPALVMDETDPVKTEDRRGSRARILANDARAASIFPSLCISVACAKRSWIEITVSPFSYRLNGRGTLVQYNVQRRRFYWIAPVRLTLLERGQ